MTRDEYYQSPQFLLNRLLNNVSHEIQSKGQHLYDLFAMLGSLHPETIFCCHDKYTIAERQLRIVMLETSKLFSALSNLESITRPRKFDDDPITPLPDAGQEPQETR